MAEGAIDLHAAGLTAAEIVTALGLQTHPEGGWYKETWRDVPAEPGRRGAATTILFLLKQGEESAWHRVDAAEIWLFHAGAPLELRIAEAGVTRTVLLGPVLRAETGSSGLQAVVPAFAWQAARSVGTWSLVSCVVAPAFEFAGFEMAPNNEVPLLKPE